MKIKTDKQTLLNITKILQGLDTTQVTSPILNNFVMETKKDKLYIIATNLNTEVKIDIDIKVIKEGSITVPIRKFIDIVRNLSDGNVEISVEKETIKIKSGKCNFKVIGLVKENFPTMPIIKDIALTIKNTLLTEMLSSCIFAVSKDFTKLVLNGVYFISDGKKIETIATDSRRLALISKDLDGDKNIQKKVIIPTKTVQLLLDNLTDKGNVELKWNEDRISFNLDNIVITSNIIKEEFPNYEQVIPKKKVNEIDINREEFLDAVKRSAIFVSPLSQSIKLTLSKDKLTFSKTNNKEEVTEDIKIKYDGNEFSVNFNPDYLLDVLKTLKDETIKLELASPTSPGIIRSKDYIYIILPIQTT